MPFTLAHPAAVLPFFKLGRRVHAPALVLGSMAPDFEYFLRGRTFGVYGHTLWGQLWFNLPLVAVVYAGCACLGWMPASSSQGKRPLVLHAFVFAGSALAGMFTHIAWDSLTHSFGAMVLLIPALRQTLWGIPAHSLLQHGGTAAGLGILAWYFAPAGFGARQIWGHAKRNALFLSLPALLSVLFFTAWMLAAPVPCAMLGTLVVRLMDSMLVAFLLLLGCKKWMESRRAGAERRRALPGELEMKHARGGSCFLSLQNAFLILREVDGDGVFTFRIPVWRVRFSRGRRTKFARKHETLEMTVKDETFADPFGEGNPGEWQRGFWMPRDPGQRECARHFQRRVEDAQKNAREGDGAVVFEHEPAPGCMGVFVFLLASTILAPVLAFVLVFNLLVKWIPQEHLLLQAWWVLSLAVFLACLGILGSSPKCVKKA